MARKGCLVERLPREAQRGPKVVLIVNRGENKASSFVNSLGLGARVQGNVFASGGAIQPFKRAETCDIVAVPLLGPLGFSVRRRLTKGCQIHLS